MTTPTVTELRRNGNAMLERPAANTRPPASRRLARVSPTQPRTIHAPAAALYPTATATSHDGRCGTVRAGRTDPPKETE